MLPDVCGKDFAATQDEREAKGRDTDAAGLCRVIAVVRGGIAVVRAHAGQRGEKEKFQEESNRGTREKRRRGARPLRMVPTTISNGSCNYKQWS